MCRIRNIAKWGLARFGLASKRPDARTDTGGRWGRQAALVGPFPQTLPGTQPPVLRASILDLCLRGCLALQRPQTTIGSALRDTRRLCFPSRIIAFFMTLLAPLNPVNLLKTVRPLQPLFQQTTAYTETVGRPEVHLRIFELRPSCL